MSVGLRAFVHHGLLACLGFAAACFNPTPHTLGTGPSESSDGEASETGGEASEDASGSETASDESSESSETTDESSSQTVAEEDDETAAADASTHGEPSTSTSTSTSTTEGTSPITSASSEVTDGSTTSTTCPGGPDCSDAEADASESDEGPTPRGGDYVVSGERHGATFLQIAPNTTTVSTDRLDAREVGEPLCVDGTLQPGLLNYVRLGINLAQPEVDDEPASVPLTGSGLALDVTLDAPEEVQLFSILYADPDGATSWCAPISPPGRKYLDYPEYSEFQCFGGGDPYDPTTPVTSVVFMVTTLANEPADFDLCVFGFGEGDSLDDAQLDE